MASRSSGDIYAETLRVFDDGDGVEPLTTPEVADALDANRRTVYKRLETLVESDVTPHSGSVNVIETNGEETRFEIELVDPPVLSSVQAHDGYVDEARIEDGEYYLCIHATPGANVRDIIDLVVDTYPATEMITRRQMTRSETPLRQIASVLADRLTERQQAALEAGYFGGFFDWPRKGSGEEIADSLDISPSTFHQHVRKAEKKMLEVILEEG